MKTLVAVALLLSSPRLSRADFEPWTNTDGVTVEMELLGKTQKDGQLAGKFRTRDGRTVIVSSAKLDTAGQIKVGVAPDAPAVANNGADGARPAAAPSVFDKILDGNLVRLEGEMVKEVDRLAKPSKYYVFYYSASWCGPCQAYTPQLAEMYKKIKPGNDTFELVFISSDDNRKDQEAYMKTKKMPWPALGFSKVKGFKKEFDHGVRGIPSVIICDLEGKVVSREESTAALEALLAPSAGGGETK